MEREREDEREIYIERDKQTKGDQEHKDTEVVFKIYPFLDLLLPNTHKDKSSI